jgi:hypothetical protein
MSKKIIVIIALALISSFLLFYLIFSSKVIKVQDGNQKGAIPEKQKINLTEVTLAHKNEITYILNETESLSKSLASDKVSADTSSTSDLEADKTKLQDLKNKLANLKAPSEKFGKLHINLMLALTNFNKYSENKKKEYLKEGIDSLEIAKEEYKSFFPLAD